MRDILKGSTDQSTVIRIVDSTDGTPETGVVFNTAGIDLWYRRELATKTSITEATLAALDTAHADGGFLHIGDGYYRLDLPDAAVASGADGVMVGGTVTGMVVIGSYHKLTDFDLSGQSAIDLKDFADAGYDPSTNKVQGVVLVDTLTTYTGNTVQTGDVFPLASTEIADIKAKTDNLPSDPADQSLIIAATNAIVAILGTPAGASMSADVAAVQSDTNDIQTRLPAALSGGFMKADVLAVDTVTADADALGRVASNLDRAAKCVTHGTVDTGATPTSIPTSSLSPAAVVANQFQAEILGFPEDTTTAALRGQKTRIVGNTSGGVFEVEALTTAPVSGDVFVIE